MMERLKNKKLGLEDWKLFGGLNAILAVFVGVYGSTFSYAASKFPFYIPAPIFTFFILGFAWKFTLQKKGEVTIFSLTAMVLTLVPLLHFLSYLSLVYFELLHANFFPTEYHTHYSTADFIFFFGAAILFTPISIYKLFFLTLILPFSIGIWILRKKKSAMEEEKQYFTDEKLPIS